MNIPKDIALKIMEESATFRELVLNRAYAGSERDTIISYLMEHRKEKIACIKYVRDKFYPQDVMNAFPEWKFDMGTGDTAGSKIGLKSSKEFVEHMLSVL